MISNVMFKIVKFGFIIVKQVKYVLGSFYWVFDIMSWVVFNEFVDVILCYQYFIDSGGELFVQGCYLGGNIVRVFSNGLIGELSGQV